MKTSVINIYFIFYCLVCHSQTEMTNAEIIKNFGTEQLKGCQVYNKAPQAFHCEDTSRIYHSYDFDDKGNIEKELISKRWEDTILNVYTYNSANKLSNQISYTKRRNGRKDTILTIYSYNDKNNISSVLKYLIHYPDKQDNYDKSLFYYNQKDQLEKKIYLDYFPSKKQFDTAFTVEFKYYSSEKKETETIVDYEGIYLRTGKECNKSKYDELGRLIEFNHYTLQVKKNKDDPFGRMIHTTYKSIADSLVEEKRISTDSSGNYNCYYTYLGDSLTLETHIDNYTYKEYTTIRNKDKKVIKTIGYNVGGGNTKCVKGKYIPDLEMKCGSISKNQTIYQYDKFGRISKCIEEYDYNYKDNNGGMKGKGKDSKEFVYKDNKPYILPEEKYIEDYK